MHRVIALSWFQLTRLIRNHAITPVVIVLHERASDCIIGRITDHVQWPVWVGNRQNGCFDQTLFDRIEGVLALLRPFPFHVFLS